MNHTNHKKNAGSFGPGQDRRRNTNGQQSKDAVALGALLKKYLVEQADETPDGWAAKYGTNAKALAATIWETAIEGKFPFVQFLADRLIGKVDAQQDELRQGMLKFSYGEAANEAKQ